MDLKKLFEMQRVLDKRINDEKGLRYTKPPAWKRVALLTEIGELANEWRGFKKWSHDQIPRNWCELCQLTEMPHKCSVPLLEEYVDGLSFILSIGIDLGSEDYAPTYSSIGVSFGEDDELTIQFEEVYRYASSFNTFPVNDKKTWYSFVFDNYLGLGQMLGLEWPEIEKAYFQKNAENHQRQAEGY
ncbi:dUTP diphosphatase [Domibacillus aminovorans]|uniref:dUTPase n=1 Tax=Domibacillus aminovorans TaxID=29332 RepID=A0A177L519_9BACI|nr:dUTP diphosphatase [Domibacillus aminovorans]OAH60382.1 hypothetical protein AWH49_16785 [Domibacillus aminovorans]